MEKEPHGPRCIRCIACEGKLICNDCGTYYGIYEQPLPNQLKKYYQKKLTPLTP